MPSTGTPTSYSAASIDGASSTCTDAGPPERMIPFGRRASISCKGIVRGTISLYTCASRTRRAISCAYWAPKSTTRTVSNGSSGTAGDLVTHSHAMRPLEGLALGLKGGGDHDLGLLELLDGLVAARRHRGAQGAEQVEAAVVLVGRADENLLERAARLGADAGAAGQHGMERGHAPVVALARRLVGGGERGADHHRVSAEGDGLG